MDYFIFLILALLCCLVCMPQVGRFACALLPFVTGQSPVPHPLSLLRER